VVLSAFLRRHGEEGGGLLVQAFTATLRTLDLVLFVFRKGKEDFKWLLAIFAIELIARHVDLRKRQRGGALFQMYAQGTPVSRELKRTKRTPYGGALSDEHLVSNMNPKWLHYNNSLLAWPAARQGLVTPHR
jgi:hypothetical protein